MNERNIVFSTSNRDAGVGDYVYVPYILEKIAYADDEHDEIHFYFEDDDDYFRDSEILWDSYNDSRESLIALLYTEGCRYVYRDADYVEIASAFAWNDGEPVAQGTWIGSYGFFELFPEIPEHQTIDLLSLGVPKPKYEVGTLVYDAFYCRIGMVRDIVTKSPGVYGYLLYGSDKIVMENRIKWDSESEESLALALERQYLKYTPNFGWNGNYGRHLEILPIENLKND